MAFICDKAALQVALKPSTSVKNQEIATPAKGAGSHSHPVF
jgi:hypothetical protein